MKGGTDTLLGNLEKIPSLFWRAPVQHAEGKGQLFGEPVDLTEAPIRSLRPMG